MKITLSKLFLILTIFMFGFISCDDDNKDSDEDTLYVKFVNSTDSEYTITGIQLLNMGVAGVEEEPVGEFGDNILTDGQVIAPGEHLFFTMDIPNLNYAYYRLTVDNGDGAQVFLHDQVDYVASYDGVIEHWGGDDRTVEVTIKWNTEFDYIYVQAWSNWVGID